MGHLYVPIPQSAVAYIEQNIEVGYMRGVLLGIGYILLVSYFNKAVPLVTYWKHSSFYTLLYIGPMFYLLLQKSAWFQNRNGKITSLFERVGKTSLYIYSFQMVFFSFGIVWTLMGWSPFVLCPLSLVVCTIGGILWFDVD